MLTAIDQRVCPKAGQNKPWRKTIDLAAGRVIHDNQLGDYDFEDPTTVIGGGSIVIHKG